MGLENLFDEKEHIDVVKYANEFLKPLSIIDSYSPMYETIRRNKSGSCSRFTRLS